MNCINNGGFSGATKNKKDADSFLGMCDDAKYVYVRKAIDC